ncbi:MAG: NifU family protein, partial [Clostridiales Family XIII bacterium]|nr:NifU family protein [Clostridiales Family XIII bacterium]
MEDQIRSIIKENVNPVLSAHFGAAELSSYEEGIAYVRLTGACGGCPSAQDTMDAVIRSEIMG